MDVIYGTAIKVIAGFYFGCTGIVVEQYEKYVDQFVADLECKEAIKGGTLTSSIRGIRLDRKDFEIVNLPRQEKK